MSALRYACESCGTWTCSRCGWKRPGASVAYRRHICGHCGSTSGTIISTMHTEKMWACHNQGPLPTGYPYGERPEGGPEEPFGTVVSNTTPEVYRGILVPRLGPYGHTDIPSWKRGVDDALKAWKGVTP